MEEVTINKRHALTSRDTEIELLVIVERLGPVFFDVIIFFVVIFIFDGLERWWGTMAETEVEG